MGVVILKNCTVCEQGVLRHFLHVKDHSISQESFELIECEYCGFLMTQNHPDATAIGPYYASEDYISHTNTTKGLVNQLYHKVRSYMLVQKQKLVERYCSGGRLLDVGTGTGYFLSHMRNGGWQVTGLEPDTGARKVAKERFGLDIDDIEALYSLAEESFDVITMWHVLEHVHSLNHNLAQINRLLCDRGWLIIAVPNPTSSDATHYGKFWAAYDVPRHLWHFSPKSMKLLLEKHGFDLRDTKGMPFDAFYVSLLSEKYRHSPLGTLKGGLAGLVTNIKSLGDTRHSSSLIYIARKKI
jgi:2-polyprenyl-3-methyl-5-hydroxy-6-metoxy-1,4-benzoquinol methylase